jgi:hypothetical protein
MILRKGFEELEGKYYGKVRIGRKGERIECEVKYAVLAVWK